MSDVGVGPTMLAGVIPFGWLGMFGLVWTGAGFDDPWDTLEPGCAPGPG